MNLAKHIFELIKFNECVVVPEFGAFISNYKPAHFDQQSSTFSPPSKEVIFNTKVTQNDGLLINYIAEKEKVSFHNAEQCILTFVDRTYNQLKKGEYVELEEIGTLKLDKYGTILFHPFQSFELIEAYGLSEVTYSTILDKQKVFQPGPIIRTMPRKRDLVKIAAGFGLLLALSLYPVRNGKQTLQSSVIFPDLAETVSNKTTPKAEPIENNTAIVLSEQLAKEHPYILVGGSFGDFKNAAQLQNKLVNEGYNSEISELGSGLYRVIVESFESKEEAIHAMKSYRKKSNNSSAWVGTR